MLNSQKQKFVPLGLMSHPVLFSSMILRNLYELVRIQYKQKAKCAVIKCNMLLTITNDYYCSYHCKGYH